MKLVRKLILSMAGATIPLCEVVALVLWDALPVGQPG